jgi:hypothetical protein
MAWFASTLQAECADELNNLNTLAVNTLMALNAFSVMHDVACESQPGIDVYCYLNAVRSTTPSDSYYYQLPFGIPLPKTSSPSCSACSQSVMHTYVTALQDAVTGPLLTGLKATYKAAAELSAQSCGASFAATSIVSSAVSKTNTPSWLLIGLLAIFGWTTSAQFS